MAPDIIDLLPSSLKPLLPLEELLIKALPLGLMVSDFPDGPIDMAQIGTAQSVRSELLMWVLNHPEASKLVHPRGLRLRGAKLLGELNLEDAHLEFPLKLINCILAEKMVLERGVFSHLDFTGSHTGPVLADAIQVTYEMIMKDGFKAAGVVSLLGATLGEILDCTGGEFENPTGYALCADGLTTHGAVYLGYGFKAKGEVRLVGAEIGGDLDCSDGEFENPKGKALIVDRVTARGAVYLRDGFKAKGEVRLIGAEIGGDLDCSGGEFENPDGAALLGDGLTTRGSVYLRSGFKAHGEVSLPVTDITGNLDCSTGEFENPQGNAFNGNGMKVNGSFVWRGLAQKPGGVVNLENAHLTNLDDDEASWPASGSLSIDGLVYGPFTSHVPADARSRLRWLALRNPKYLNVQPYEQLLGVFRQMGLRDDAREVAIAKQKAIRQQLRGLSRFWSWILDATIAYGYRPEKVILLFIIPLILLGSLIFKQADILGIMEPAANQPPPSGKALVFDPVGYSLDVFLPIVDLHQETAWQPDASAKNGIYFQVYQYFHILAGWFFTTLAVAAVSGLVRSD